MTTDPRRTRELPEIAKHGTVYERTTIAHDPDLPVEAQLALAADPRPHIAMSIPQNYEVQQDVIRTLAQVDPALAEDAAGHPNAPVDLKETIPARHHSGLAVERYLDDRDATEGQRTYVWDDHLDHATLGQVWARALDH